MSVNLMTPNFTNTYKQSPININKQQYAQTSFMGKKLDNDTVEISSKENKEVDQSIETSPEKETQKPKSGIKRFGESIKNVWDSGMWGKLMMISCFTGHNSPLTVFPMMFMFEDMQKNIIPQNQTQKQLNVSA